MSEWKPARRVTKAQRVRAETLLRVWLKSGEWSPGLTQEEGDVQYRAAYHPNVGKPGRHPGVEVWYRVTPAPAPAVASAQTTAAPAPPNALAPVSSERELVLREGERRGWPRAELDASVAIESGWNPASHNKQRFGGLIGFSPSFAKRHAGSPEKLWAMSIAQQAPLVGRYFDEVMSLGKKWSVPGDTYLALAAPAYVGASDDTVVYRFGTKAWDQNPGWRPKGGGHITAGSIRAVVLRKMARLGGKPAPAAAPSSAPGPARAGSFGGSFGMLVFVALVGLAAWFLQRKKKKKGTDT